MFKEDWVILQRLITTNDLDGAEIFVKKMHQTYQKHALMHARIHFAWSRIARLRKAYLWSIGQRSTDYARIMFHSVFPTCVC